MCSFVWKLSVIRHQRGHHITDPGRTSAREKISHMLHMMSGHMQFTAPSSQLPRGRPAGAAACVFSLNLARQLGGRVFNSKKNLNTSFLPKTAKEDEEEMQEVMVSLAAAKERSVDAAVAVVLSEQTFFTLKKRWRTALRASLGGRDVCFVLLYTNCI